MWNQIRINKNLILINNLGELKLFYCKTELQTDEECKLSHKGGKLQKRKLNIFGSLNLDLIIPESISYS